MARKFCTVPRHATAPMDNKNYKHLDFNELIINKLYKNDTKTKSIDYSTTYSNSREGKITRPNGMMYRMIQAVRILKSFDGHQLTYCNDRSATSDTSIVVIGEITLYMPQVCLCGQRNALFD